MSDKVNFLRKVTVMFSFLYPNCSMMGMMVRAVFACVDGVWYESCLTEDGFRLLAPEAESVQLVTTAAESASIYQAELTN